MSLRTAALYTDTAVVCGSLILKPKDQDATVSFGGVTLTGVGPPDADTDAVTLAYLKESLSNQTTSLVQLPPVNFATTNAFDDFNVVGDVIAGDGNRVLEVDGVEVQLNHRILVKNFDGQDGAMSGIYLVTVVGSDMDTFEMKRSTDTIVAGALTEVLGGKSNHGSTWVATPESAWVSVSAAYPQIGAGMIFNGGGPERIDIDPNADWTFNKGFSINSDSNVNLKSTNEFSITSQELSITSKSTVFKDKDSERGGYTKELAMTFTHTINGNDPLPILTNFGFSSDCITMFTLKILFFNTQMQQSTSGSCQTQFFVNNFNNDATACVTTSSLYLGDGAVYHMQIKPTVENSALTIVLPGPASGWPGGQYIVRVSLSMECCPVEV